MVGISRIMLRHFGIIYVQSHNTAPPVDNIAYSLIRNAKRYRLGCELDRLFMSAQFYDMSLGK